MKFSWSFYWWPFPLYSFPIFLQLFPGNFKDVPKACCCLILLFCDTTLFCVCLIRCQLFFLFFLCPGKQISKLSLGDGDEDLGCCLLSCACPWQKRSSACSGVLCSQCRQLLQPKGNPHYFVVHVQEVLEKLSVVFLTLYFPLKLLIFRYPQGNGKG